MKYYNFRIDVRRKLVDGKAVYEGSLAAFNDIPINLKGLLERIKEDSIDAARENVLGSLTLDLKVYFDHKIDF